MYVHGANLTPMYDSKWVQVHVTDGVGQKSSLSYGQPSIVIDIVHISEKVAGWASCEDLRQLRLTSAAESRRQ